MISKSVLEDWLVEALQELGGSAKLLDVSKQVWRNHGTDLEDSDLFYTWQYDLRWAAKKLRDSGRMKPSMGKGSRSSSWELA